MKKLINSFLIIVMWVWSWLKPNQALFKLLFAYKKITINYYNDLLIDFFNVLKDKNYWISLFYNKNIGMLDNVVLFLFFVPLFRFILSLFRLILLIIYSFYYIYVNITFDLIIIYVDIYAKKFGIFFESSMIVEINDLRKVILLTNFKKNFLANFKVKKDIIIDGFVYKEEFINKFIRIFFNLVVFFIWWMPLFLGFFSYIVRFIFAIIWGSIVIVFWFIAKCIVKVLFYTTIFFVRLKLKIFYFRKKKILRKTYSKLLKKKRYNWTRFVKLHVFFGKLLRNLFNIKYLSLSNIFKWSKSKNYYRYPNKRFHYINDRMFKINLFNVILDKLNDRIINRLSFFNNIEHTFFFKFKNYVMYFLNIKSFYSIMHFFLGYHVYDYSFKNFKYKYKSFFKSKIYKWYRRWLYLYWERLFPVVILFMEILSIFFWLFYLFIIIIKYCVYMLCLVISIILKIIYSFFVIVFFGREK